MRTKVLCCVALLSGAMTFMTSCQSNDVILCKDGKAVSRIVVPTEPTDVERHSSVIMQRYLKEITGENYEIVSDEGSPKKNDINIGRVNRPEIEDIDFPSLEADGYVIKTDNGRITIAGGSKRGTLYGVYGFLEKFLGCRKYSSKVSIIPPRFNIELQDIDVKEVPVFKYREVLYRDAYDQEYMEWHGLGKHYSDEFNQSDWGSWCHTFHAFVPPEEYSKNHPEYYSMINGKRLFSTEKRNIGQLCLTNEDVFDITYKNLKKRVDANPYATFWSVSQMDNGNYCHCPECLKANEEAGSTQGSIIPYINKLAKKFPDKIISTLAYWYSTRPPKGLKVEKNVNIMLCNIGSPRHVPIEKGDSTFTADLKGWYKIHDNFIIWDYVIQFSHLIAPFPNLRVLQPNLQFLHKTGVKSMFEQGNREVGGEFCELRAYILAKLMWNPYQDVNVIIDDFLNGYYGKAGKYIREYIDLIHDTMESSGGKLNIFGRPWDNRNTFLTEEMISKYYDIFAKAEEAVKDDYNVLFRVRTAKTAIDYAVLDIARKEITGKRGALEEKDGKFVIKDDFSQLLQKTMRKCITDGVTRVHEWNTTPAEYINKITDELNKQAEKIKK